MSALDAVRVLLRRVRLLVGWRRAARELDEEMQLHRELLREKLRTNGFTEAQATHASNTRFGNVNVYREASGDARGWRWFDSARQDLSFAIRTLRRTPAFTLAVVGTLAFGTGAATAMFSGLDAAVLRALPFPRAHELVTLNGVSVPFNAPGQEAIAATPAHPIQIDEARAMSRTFAGVAAYAGGGLNLSDATTPRRVNAGVVTTDFFSVLSVAPVAGRGFVESDASGDTPVTVLSWGLWQDHFGGADVLNRSVPLNGKSYRIIGVMPKGFAFPDDAALWIPMAVPNTFATFEAFRGYLPITIVGRLAPGLTPEQGSAQVVAEWERRRSLDPPTPGRQSALAYAWEEVRENGAMLPLQTHLVGDKQRAFVLLFAATIILLLIACANVANLLLGRGVHRARELAVRTVLGATRVRIVRQLLAETLLLAIAASVGGLALSALLGNVLRELMPRSIVAVAPIRLDLRVMAFGSLLALVTTVLCGVWPALRSTQQAPAESIKGGAGHGATSAGARRSQRALVAVELALSMMLLVGAALMLRSFQQVLGVDTGIDPEQVATLELGFARSPAEVAGRTTLVNDVLRSLQRTPGVRTAGVVTDLPLRGGGGIAVSLNVPGAPASAADVYVRPLYASPGYFETLGIALRRGRAFTADDARAGDTPPRSTRSTRGPVALINEATARAFWPGVDAVGRTFQFGGDSTPITIVGIVADVREAGLERDPQPQLYFPLTGTIPNNIAIVARGTLDTDALLAQMIRAVHASSPSQAVYNARSMDAVVSASLTSRRVNTQLVSLFGVMALVLCTMGVYSVTSFAVTQRFRELGIRAALGASATNLVRLLGRDMLVHTIAGVTAGLALSWAFTRVLASQLFGVTSHDPATFVIAPSVLFVALVFATAIPLRRLAVLDPAQVIRDE